MIETFESATAAKPGANQSAMLAALQALFEPGDVIELRALHKGKKRTDAGYFDADHWPQLVAHAERLNNQGAAVYVTLNPVNPQLLGRYNNRVQDYADATATDNDIVMRRWLLVDIDPKRPKNTSATPAQFEAAQVTARCVYQHLAGRGWPAPIVGESGNGMHLLYPLALPNDTASRDAVKAALQGLAARFDTDMVSIDVAVFNAGRITKLYGTVANKGDHTNAAPWRLSRLVSVPERSGPVTVEQLRDEGQLPADDSQSDAGPAVSHSINGADGFDLPIFLGRLGIGYDQDTHEGSDRYKLHHCPFNPEHGKGEAAVFRRASGALAFKCLHNTCAGNDWHRLRELVDGPRERHLKPQGDYNALTQRIDAGDESELDAIAADIAASGLSRSREELLLKRLAKRFGLTLGSLRADLQAEKRSRSEEGNDHLRWAQQVIKQMGPGDVLFSQGTFWRWDASGVWGKADDREVKQATHATIGDDDSITRTLVDGVVDLVKTELYAANSPFDQQDWRRVNVLNGTLMLDGGEWRLDPHCRDDFLTTQLPVAYDPQAQCPRFAQFLQEVFEGDPDIREKALCVLEAIGYTLLTTCRFEKFFLLIGAGANGKSVLLSVVEALVGSRFVCAVQPSQFENRFQRAHLHGKLANIVTEIAEGAEVADAQLKAIVSGELTTAEHKLRPPFDFRPYATCWFGTNHLPHTRDFSDALFRRAIVLNFNRRFYAKDRDPHLKDKLLDELPGILSMSLRAIAGVLQRGEFTIPPSSTEAANKWRTEADQAAQFLEDECITGAHLKTPSSVVYDAYTQWAAANGIAKRLNRKNFTTRLERLGMSAGKSTGGMRVILGLGVRREAAA